MPEKPLLVTLPDPRILPAIEALPHPLPPGAVEWLEWEVDGPAPAPRLDLVVMPNLFLHERLPWLAGVEIGLVQGQSIGYEEVRGRLAPGLVFANAATVHETATAELAMALVLAAQRGLDVYARQSHAGVWSKTGLGPGLADTTVLLLGYGGINKGVEARLAGFEVERIIRVASRARETEAGPVHAASELHALLPQADIVIVATPVTDATRGILGAEELALLPDGALVVNVGRGPLLQTDAALKEAGRLRFALDVTDPEPLPAGHPLWTAPGVLITPHVGGASDAFLPRTARLVRRQVEHLLAGEEPENVVLRS